MSLVVQTTDGGAVETGFRSINPTDGVRIGEHEVSLEDFCAMAVHYLNGGFFGWSNHETPEAINNALSGLFEFYEQVDGKWTRKKKYQVSI